MGISPLPPDSLSHCWHGCLLDSNYSLQDDPWHWLNCNGLKRTAGLEGHDTLAHIILKTASKVHQTGQWQPTNLTQDSRLQPDLLLYLDGKRLLCDVTVINPIAPSKLKGPYWTTFAATTHIAEQNKINKYKQLGQTMGAEVVGMAFNVFGGMGPGAHRILTKLATLSQEAYGISPSQFATHLFDAVAIAVVRRVGSMIAEGLVRQHQATCRMRMARPSRDKVRRQVSFS
jgi:hypothetical protein